MSQDFISGQKNEMLEKEPERPVHGCEGRVHWEAFSRKGELRQGVRLTKRLKRLGFSSLGE